MGRRIMPGRVLSLLPADMERAGVGPRYWSSSLSRLSGDLPYTGFIRKWASDVAAHVQAGRGLILYGPFGSGKTCISVCLIKEVLAREGTALKIAARDLVKYTIENPAFDRDYTWMDRIREVDLLVLDDLGAEHRSEFSRGAVENLIRDRLESMRSLVISTNLTRELLKEALGEATVNAMTESLYPVEIAGIDWRATERDELTRVMRGYGQA